MNFFFPTYLTKWSRFFVLIVWFSFVFILKKTGLIRNRFYSSVVKAGSPTLTSKSRLEFCGEQAGMPEQRHGPREGHNGVLRIRDPL